MSNKFDLTNWNFAFYSTETFKALISLSGEEINGEVRLMYCPTVLEGDNREVFQENFIDLGDAIEFMNNQYGHWEFMEPTGSGSGCSTCQAH